MKNNNDNNENVDDYYLKHKKIQQEQQKNNNDDDNVEELVTVDESNCKKNATDQVQISKEENKYHQPQIEGNAGDVVE